ncbi:hypothetical protein D3C74_346010 [compost metagenome]
MPSNAPNTTSIDSSGMTASTDSTRPRFAGSVESVTQAWNAASLAPEPNNDMTASSATTATAATTTAFAAGTSPETVSGLRNPNAAVVMPHRTYPAAMNTRRRPTLSESAPTRSVARVAATALTATMVAMTFGSSVMVS